MTLDYHIHHSFVMIASQVFWPFYNDSKLIRLLMPVHFHWALLICCLLNSLTLTNDV